MPDLNDVANAFARIRSRRPGPRIGTLCGMPIYDFIESQDGSRWAFDGKLFEGRVRAATDIVHHQAVYAQVVA